MADEVEEEVEEEEEEEEGVVEEEVEEEKVEEEEAMILGVKCCGLALAAKFPLSCSSLWGSHILHFLGLSFYWTFNVQNIY